MEAARETAPLTRADIQHIQRQLQMAGLDPGAPNGVVGTKTRGALRQYQRSHGLPVTGLPDAATQRAMAEEEHYRQAQAEHRQSAPEGGPRQGQDVRVAVGMAPAPASEAPRKTLVNSLGMEFVLLPAGEFFMGSADGPGPERPAHKVILSRPFYMGKYEVTQGQWVDLMGNNPSYFTSDREATDPVQEVGNFFRRLGGEEIKKAGKWDPQRPVERVSWNDAQEFIRRLNTKEGHDKYRLPTEAEWEYAARAGSTRQESLADGPIEQYGWYVQNAGGITHGVGQLKPNAWGLFDLCGNVWEWVQDWWAPYAVGPVTDPQGPNSGTLKVYRGGAWTHAANTCRPANRMYVAPAYRHTTHGFRLVRTAP
jgi:formylglycine-generating enzyme required for sulfatase activity